MMETKPELISKAWRMRMLNQAYDAGVLMATEGKVSFMTRSGPLFEADKQDVKAKWPWWYFGAGVHLIVGDKRYRIYFTPPQGAEFELGAFADVLPPLAVFEVLNAGRAIREGRASRKAWRTYLGPGSVPAPGEL
jgi:hypothetical protein